MPSRAHAPLLVLPLIALAACGDDGAQPDAAPDDAIADTPVDTGDSGPCGADRFVTGELVDFDSTITSFRGVPNATFTVQGGSQSDATSPNGRFELCAPAIDPMLFDVDAPATSFNGTPYLDGPAYIEAEALTSGMTISFRGLTTARAETFYAERGLTYDPTKAHVLVFLAGDRSAVTLDRAHDTAQAGNDDATAGTFTWTAGDSGRFVLFPNVDATSATGTLTGDKPHTIPLAAGELTLVAVSWVFL